MSKVFEEDAPFGLGTRAVHAGQRPDPTTGAIMIPLYQTSTYAQEGIGRNKGYEYARGKNPTREALERNVASLEGGRHGFAFGSGMGALDSVMKLFKSGDHFVCAENMYGGTPRLFEKILVNFGFKFSYVDCRDPQQHRGCDHAGDARHHRRNADESADAPHRSRRSGRARTQGGCVADCRQHVCYTGVPEAIRLRCRHRVPLEHEVPEWAQRYGRRRGDCS